MSQELPPIVTSVAVTPPSGPGGNPFTALVTASDVPAMRIAYQWRLDGTDIPGATGATHIGTSAGQLAVRVTVTNAHGSDSRDSAPVAVSPGLEPPAVTEVAIIPRIGGIGTRFTVTTVATGVPVPALSYQWLLDGVPICGATTPSHVACRAGQLSVRVTARNSEGSDNRGSEAIAVQPAGIAPLVTAVRITPGSGRAGETFAAEAEATGQPAPRLSYQWYLDGAAVAGATDAAHVPAGPGVLTVRVTAMNDTGSASLDSEGVQVRPEFSLPQVRAADILPNAGRVGDTFVVTTTTCGFPEPDLQYEWFLDDSPIPEVTGDTYTSDREGTIYVRITATSSQGQDMRESGAVLIEPALAAPTLSDAVVSPETGRVGDTFDAIVTAAGNPVPELLYQWVLDGIDIEGATAARHVAGRAGLLQVRVTARNSEGIAESESLPVPVGLAIIAPVITEAAITPPGGRVDDAFVVAATASGEPAPGLTYQWLLDGTPIEGATGAAHVAARTGVLSVQVTALNPAGSDLREAAGVPVLAALAAPEIVAAEVQPGEGRIGDTFSLAATITGNPVPELRCQWLLDGEEISGASGASLVASVEGRLTVRVTATNTEGIANHETGAAIVLSPETLLVFERGVFEEGVFL